MHTGHVHDQLSYQIAAWRGTSLVLDHLPLQEKSAVMAALEESI